MRKALLCVILILVPSITVAQSVEPPSRVAVTSSTEDPVGNTLAYEIREEISASEQMQLVETNPDAGTVVVRIITLDPYDGELSGNTTAYSATWSFYFNNEESPVDLFLTSQVGLAGQKQVNSVANDIAAETDKQRRKVPEKLLNLANFVKSIEDEDG